MTRSVTGPGPLRLLALLNAVVLACALVATATGAAGERTPERLATLALEGVAVIDGADGVRRVTAGDHGLVAGEEVEILSGEGVLRLGGERALELRAGEQGGSRVAMGPIPTVEGGDVLALAGDEELVVEAAETRLSLVGGAARISRATGASFVVYQGRAGLTSGGRTLEGGLPPLRQVVVSDAGMLPLGLTPMRFDHPPDPWERRFLGEAIALEGALERRSVGFTSSLRDDFTPDIFFFHAVLPGLRNQPSFDQALLDEQDRPVGETLVGAAVALMGRGDDFAHRWDEVFDLRTRGAGWGVVAADQGAPWSALLSALDGAVGRSPLLFAPPSSDVFQPPAPPVRRRPVTPPPPAPPVVRPVRPSSPPPPPPPAPPPPPPAPAPARSGDEGVLDPLVDPVGELLDGVLDELGGATDGLL